MGVLLINVFAGVARLNQIALTQTNFLRAQIIIEGYIQCYQMQDSLYLFWTGGDSDKPTEIRTIIPHAIHILV